MTQTINLEPNWDAMRDWVRHVARTDRELAKRIAAEMGSEAPDLSRHFDIELVYFNGRRLPMRIAADSESEAREVALAQVELDEHIKRYVWGMEVPR